MPIHKTVEEAGAHLEEAARTIIPRRYEAAIPKVRWAEPATTKQAEENWWTGLTEARAADRRRVRIREVGDAAIQKGMREKGARVIGTRIIAVIGKYKAKIRAPMEAAIAAIKAAPPKTRVVMENINNRLIPVINAQREAVGKERIT